MTLLNINQRQQNDDFPVDIIPNNYIRNTLIFNMKFYDD